MKCRVGVICSLAVAFAVVGFAGSGAVAATDMPAIKASGRNKVPECATPGRLMAFIAERNGALDAKFSNIATEYMRHGEEMEVRWDYAFFQMLLETGNLSFRESARSSDLTAKQNNFAGLGAVGKGEPGESFRDVASGVRAHLQHLLMYSGARIASPVAERTKKVQEWGILTAWHKGFKRPITYTDLARKWAPDMPAYGGDLHAAAQSFYGGQCKQPDPSPDRVAEARNIKTSPVASAADAESGRARIGDEIAKRAIEQARKEGQPRSALGAAKAARQAGEPATPQAELPQQTAAAGAVPFKLINPPQSEPPQAQAEPPSAPAPPAKGAALGPSAGKPQAKADPSKCRVWTASYGGAKAVIIKAVSDQMVNYTVLDVNDGQERREADAFISAYAKNGMIAAEFASQAQALDRAFELCPEG